MPPWLSFGKLLPYLVAIPLIFLAGVMWDGDRRERDISQRLVRDFTNYAMVRALEGMAEKAQLWEEVRNGRATLSEWMVRFEGIMDASDDERAKFRADLAASQRRVRQAALDANETMRRLDDANTQLEKAWRDGRIPADITCGVLRSSGCPKLPGRPAGAAADGGGELPGEAAGKGDGGAGGAAAVPAGAPADRPGDGGRKQ